MAEDKGTNRKGRVPRRKTGTRKTGQVPKSLQVAGGSRQDAYDILAYQAGGKPYQNPTGTSRQDAYALLPQAIARQTTMTSKGGKKVDRTKGIKDIFGKPNKNKSGGAGFKREPKTTIEGQPFEDPYMGESLPSMVDPLAMMQQDNYTALDDLVQQMLFDSGGDSYDYESAMTDAADAIKGVYKAEIQAIRSNNKAARKQTRKSRNEIEAMYRGLAAAYGREAVQAEKQGDVQAQEIMNLGQQASQNLTATNSQIQNEAATLMQGLGIQQAAPEIMQANQVPVQQGLARINTDAASDASLVDQLGMNHSQWLERGQMGARMEGADRSADLLGQLGEYVRGNRNEIKGLKARRAQDVVNSNQQIESQAAEMQAAADAETWSRLMEYMGYRSDLEDQSFDNSLQAAQFQWDQQMGLEGVEMDRRQFANDMRNDRWDRRFKSRSLALDAQKLAASQSQSGGSESYLPEELTDPVNVIRQAVQAGQVRPGKEAALNRVISGLRSTPAYRFGSVINDGENGNGQEYKLRPEQAAYMAVQRGREMGLSEKEIQILKLAAMSSVG